jgi:hypothetical protein
VSIIKEVKAGVDNPVELAPELTEEEKDALEQRKKSLSELLRSECTGEYKIEILFSHLRSRNKPTPGALSIWGNGQKLHGGGDTKMYFCPGSMRKMSNCSCPIGFDNVNYGHVLCPACKQVWKGEEVVGEILGVWPVEIWAKKILDCFVFLGHNADVYIKQPKGDIRKASDL